MTQSEQGRVPGGDRAFQTNKGESIMNKIMMSLFAVMLAAFAYAHVMRERVKAEAACDAVEMPR